MQVKDIKDELGLRHWLKEHLTTKARIQWVEPSIYGSSIGSPDCHIYMCSEKISLELKYWEEKRRGILCKVRPVQRRWHHVNFASGVLCGVLACVETKSSNKYIILVRGDHVPKRDYADDPDSGCYGGKLDYEVVDEVSLNTFLFTTGFWK